MAAWYLNRALTNFRQAVNTAFPTRDTASDGTIGDEAHQGTSSDHNPDPEPQPDAGSVDAWDMDTDLRSGNDASAVENLKQVFQKHESSKYWIHNRQIASRDTGWRRDAYTGSNPHDRHVHWNTREEYENSSAPWVIKEAAVAADFNTKPNFGPTFDGAVRSYGQMLNDLEEIFRGKNHFGTQEVWIIDAIDQIIKLVQAVQATLDQGAGPGGLTEAQVRQVVREELDATVGSTTLRHG